MAHEWDTEPVEMVTYTPPEQYDRPWVIRTCWGNCCRPGVEALLIDKGHGVPPTIYVPEAAS
jgi:hypothetical protein